MDIFYVYPYLLLLEQGDCDAEKLNEASNDFIRHRATTLSGISAACTKDTATACACSSTCST